MHDTTTTSNRCRRHVPAATPLRLLTPAEPPKLTNGAAGVLLEILRTTQRASQDQEEPLGAA
jgi:hypothetical protein